MDDWNKSTEEDKPGTLTEEYRQYLGRLMEVLTTPAGADIICTILERCGAFEPVWSSKNPNLARQAVLKDFGQEILDDIARCSPEVHDAIQRKMRIRRKLGDALLTTTKNQE